MKERAITLSRANACHAVMESKVLAGYYGGVKSVAAMCYAWLRSSRAVLCCAVL